MFTFDPVIDAVQNGKKQFVKTFITNTKIADSLNSFIDTQTNYTKEASRAGLTMVTDVMNEMIKNGHETMKFDYTKFGEGIMKAYYSQMPKPKSNG